MRSKELARGVKAALPVVMGYIPIGLAFGVLAAQAGLSVLEVCFMSLIVYAGSSQFIGVGMLAAGASFGSIIMTTFLVNSRHLLMSASLAPYLKKCSVRWLAVIGFGITDESFAVAIGDLRSGERQPAYFAGLNFTAQLAWIVSTSLGAAVGNIIPNPQAFGLDFALPAMFIGLLVIQLRGRLGILAALTAGALSLAIGIYVPGSWNVIIASILTATIGVIAELCLEKSSRSSSV